MADNNLQASFKKLMRYAQNLAEYEQGIAEGIIDENVFVIVLEEKVAKFKGHTFEWNENVRALLAVPREELTDEEAQYNIDTRNRIILGDTKLVVVLEGLTGIHYYNDVDNNVYVSYRVVSDGYVLSYEFIINEDGGVELSQEIFALTICDMRNRDDVMLFFAGVNIFSEVKGIINGEDSTQYEVDAYNLESRFVEYNKGDKRYRVMFDESYTIIEEIDITPTGSGGGGSNITVDSEMSSTSTNPVQNKVVYSELQKKQGTISDLADIRSGAALGKTALQSVPSEYVTESELTEKGYATTSQVNDKQDRIDDLEAIRSGAAKGETAIQKVKTINGESIEGEGNIVIKGGETDTSNLATKDELNNLTNEVIANEEVHAAALNDLEERKADKEYVEDALGNIDLSAKQDKIDDLDAIRSGAALGATAIQQVKTINGEEITGEGNIEIKADVDTSTLVTKEEFTDVEEVWAASYNLLNQKISDVQQYIYDEAASRRQFDEAIAEIQSIIAENESVVTAAWNQLNTRINALEAAQRG